MKKSKTKNTPKEKDIPRWEKDIPKELMLSFFCQSDAVDDAELLLNDRIFNGLQESNDIEADDDPSNW